MSDYQITNTIAGVQNISDTSTTQNHPLGLIVQAVDRADTAYGAGEFVYGWYQISGKAVGKCLAGYADNGLVFATATAGSIDDAVVAGDRVKLAKGASAIGTPSTGLAEFEIQRPFMDDATAA
jgi:hypothetical protein